MLVAFPLLALTLTSNAVAIAGVAVAGRLPALVLAVPVGAVADRVDRRRLAVGISAVRALALLAFAAIVLAGADTLVAIYATVFVLGAGDMAFDVVSQACLPSMLPGDKLSSANGYLIGTEISGEQFVGPAVGGIAFAAASALPFAADGASFVAQAVLASRALPPGRLKRTQARFTADIREGLRWFVGHPMLRLLAGVIAALAFCQAMINAELVLYGTRVLGLSTAGYGLFFAGAASGNLLGAFTAGRVSRRLGPRASLAAAALVSGVMYLVLAVTTTVVLAATVLFVECAAIALGNVTTLTLRQRVIPPEMLGRVGAAFRTLIFGLVPIGALVGGLTAEAFGVRQAFALAGALQLFVFAAAAPSLLRLMRQTEVSEESVGGTNRGASAHSAVGQAQNEQECQDGASSSGDTEGAGTSSQPRS